MSIEADPAKAAGIPDAATSAAGQVAAVDQRAAANGAVALSAVGLTLSFGDRAILSDVNVDVRRGAVTALIGPTGSGKTTLLRTFNRMNDKVTGYRHKGDVLLEGRSKIGRASCRE